MACLPYLVPTPYPQAYMDANYITVENYLMSTGLTSQEIESIKNNLLQPGAPAESPAGEGLTHELSPGEAKAAAEVNIEKGREKQAQQVTGGGRGEL